jgi:hypothetical protein
MPDEDENARRLTPGQRVPARVVVSAAWPALVGAAVHKDRVVLCGDPGGRDE